MVKKTLYISILLCAVTCPGASADVVINEIMQSNVNTLFYENEYPDSWLELYNDSAEQTNLSGYKVGVKDKASKGYTLPEGTVINAGGYLLVYCDKTGSGLHADFRLESGKGEVYLFTPDGAVADKLSHAKMPAPDVSLGRQADGSFAWFVRATPGAANTGATTADLLPEPEFSIAGGIMAGPVSLAVSLPSDAPEGTLLCVTTDGSEPDTDDAVAAPFSIEIKENSVVRAKLLSADALPRLSTTHTYILDDESHGMDVVCVSGSPEDLYSAEKGILCPEEGVSNYMFDWRRPVNIEYFHEGKTDVNQVGETRVQGGYSRTINPQKSLAVYANKRFGEKRFDSSDFWPDKPEVKQSKSFILRNAGNDFDGAHMRDAYIQRMIGTHTDNLDWQGHRPVTVYINGVYKGVYNLRERSNEDFVEANYDGLEDIDMSENWNEQKAGSEKAVADFIEFYNRADLTLAELAEVFDIDSFLQKLAGDIYATNGDFIRNNAVIWRNATAGADNRWRVLVKDLDLGVGRWDATASINMFDVIDNYMEDETFESEEEREFVGRLARLYQFFLDDPEARELLIDRVIFFTGDFFAPEPARRFFGEMLAAFADGMPATYGVYLSGENLDKTLDAWRYHTTALIPSWLDKRPAIVAAQMAERFSLGTPFRLTVNKPEGTPVTLFGREMTQPVFDGYGFTGRTIELPAVKDMKWEVAISTDGAGSPAKIEFPLGEKAVFNAMETTARVDATLVDPAGISLPEVEEAEGAAEYFTVSGIALPGRPQTPGIYIERRGTKSQKIVIR